MRKIVPFECLVIDRGYFLQSWHDFEMRLKRAKRLGHFAYVEEVKPNSDIVVLENGWQPIIYVKED